MTGEDDDGWHWAVVALGSVVLGVAVFHFVVSGDSVVKRLAEVTFPVVVGVAVVWLGYRLQSDAEVADPQIVARWGVVGLISVLAIASYAVMFYVAETGPPDQPLFIASFACAVGVGAGTLLGLYYGRLEHRTRALAEQNDRLDEFVSILSHDLRNPLNVAQGNLELARQTDDETYFRKVENAHARIETIIEEVLTAARGNTEVPRTTAVDLETVCREAWTDLHTRDATLLVDGEATLVGNPRRLRTLVGNLFRNAVQHGPDDVTVTVGTADDGFYVADDGPGIPPENREVVFEGGYSTAPDGTGLGLSVVRHVADGHGWEADVEESEFGGVRVVVRGVDSLSPEGDAADPETV